MFWTLVAKDLRRVSRNPGPFLINLALPLCITALIGLVFGGAGEPGGLGKIKIAVVDEDDSVFSRFLGSALSNDEAKKHLLAEWLPRDEAMLRIRDNEVSAILVIPEGFSENYLTGKEVPPLSLVKNPAQSFFPAIVEELLGVAVEVLNGLSRNFRTELNAWVEIFEGDGGPNMIALSKIMLDVGNKFDRARKTLFPPLVTYGSTSKEQTDKKDNDFNIFAFLLPGLASMFLFFIADNCIRDLYREDRMKTLSRYRTLRTGLFAFILSKVAFTLAVGLVSSAILFGAGGMAFGIHWKNPIAVAIVAMAFVLFTGGFMAFLTAIARREDRADLLNTVTILGIAFVGGSFFPVNQLPKFLRGTISPIMPNYWFVQSVHNLQFGSDNLHWITGFFLLAASGLALTAAAAGMWNRSLKKGTQP